LPLYVFTALGAIDLVLKKKSSQCTTR